MVVDGGVSAGIHMPSNRDYPDDSGQVKAVGARAAVYVKHKLYEIRAAENLQIDTFWVTSAFV